MGIRRLLPAVILVALPACSGAADSGLFGPGADMSSSPGEPSASSSSGGESGTSTATDDRAPTTPGVPAPAPTSAPTPKPETPPAPPTPQPACTPELEPNDLLQRATPFTKSVCGALDRPLDVDFVAIVAPAGARKMKMVATESARLSYRILEDGDVKVGNAPATTTISVDEGSTYAIRVSSAQIAIDKATYEIEVIFEQ